MSVYGRLGELVRPLNSIAESIAKVTDSYVQREAVTYNVIVHATGSPEEIAKAVTDALERTSKRKKNGTPDTD